MGEHDEWLFRGAIRELVRQLGASSIIRAEPRLEMRIKFEQKRAIMREMKVEEGRQTKKHRRSQSIK